MGPRVRPLIETRSARELLHADGWNRGASRLPLPSFVSFRRETQPNDGNQPVNDQVKRDHECEAKDRVALDIRSPLTCVQVNKGENR